MSRVSAADIYNLTFMNVCALSAAGKKNTSGEREFSGLLFHIREKEREVKFSNGRVSIKREKLHLSQTWGFSIINYTSH